MKKATLYIVLPFLLSSAICLIVIYSGWFATPTQVSNISVGKIIGAKIIPTGLSVTQIETKTSLIVIYGTPVINVGSEAFIVTLSNDSKCLTWDGTTLCHKCGQ